jgi:hypothetical protein
VAPHAAARSVRPPLPAKLDDPPHSRQRSDHLSTPGVMRSSHQLAPYPPTPRAKGWTAESPSTPPSSSDLRRGVFPTSPASIATKEGESPTAALLGSCSVGRYPPPVTVRQRSTGMLRRRWLVFVWLLCHPRERRPPSLHLLDASANHYRDASSIIPHALAFLTLVPLG